MELRDFLAEAYTSVWVAGEVERVHQSQRGHLYFELVEKGAGDRLVGKLDAVAWRTSHQRIQRVLQASGQAIREGLALRCRGRVDFYPEGGRLQFVVDQVDPLFTLGDLERRRRETLAALEAAGLLEKNQRLTLPDIPLRVGLVTSEGSAAYHDFLTGLTESGYGFEVFLAHAAMQGSAAEAEVTAALDSLGGLELDAIVLIRGGGARSDLAAFDSRLIAEAVARCRLPVITGLGHETDRSIADVVSHTAVKTPTKVAELLVDKVRTADLALLTCEQALARQARQRVTRAAEGLRRYERLASSAQLRLGAASHDLDQKARTLELIGRRRLRETERRCQSLSERLAISVPRALERRRGLPEALAEQLTGLATSRLREMTTKLDGLERLRQALDPRHLLLQGYSMTRDAQGKLIKDPEQLTAGDLITSQLASGEITSRVEEI